MNAQQLDLRVRNLDCEHNVAAMPCQIGMKIAPMVLASAFCDGYIEGLRAALSMEARHRHDGLLDR